MAYLRTKQDAISRFTLDSATEFLFGQDVQSLSTGLAYPHRTEDSRHVGPSEAFSRAVSRSQEALVQRLRSGAFNNSFVNDFP